MPVYKRKASWLIKFDLGGKTHYESCRGSKREALNAEAKLRAGIEASGCAFQTGYCKRNNSSIIAGSESKPNSSDAL